MFYQGKRAAGLGRLHNRHSAASVHSTGTVQTAFATKLNFSPPTEAEARQIARERGIDYVVVSINPGDVIAYHYVWQGVRDVPQIRADAGLSSGSAGARSLLLVATSFGQPRQP